MRDVQRLSSFSSRPIRAQPGVSAPPGSGPQFTVDTSSWRASPGAILVSCSLLAAALVCSAVRHEPLATDINFFVAGVVVGSMSISLIAHRRRRHGNKSGIST